MVQTYLSVKEVAVSGSCGMVRVGSLQWHNGVLRLPTCWHWQMCWYCTWFMHFIIFQHSQVLWHMKFKIVYMPAYVCLSVFTLQFIFLFIMDIDFMVKNKLFLFHRPYWKKSVVSEVFRCLKVPYDCVKKLSCELAPRRSQWL